MRALQIRRYGGNDVVELAEVAPPELRPNDLRIAVRAASVNPLDFKIRQGGLKAIRPFPMPLVLGSDLSGVVTEVGPAVDGFRVGDEVFARVQKERLGAFAEEAVVDAGVAAHKPASLDHVHAAAVPLAGLTAWQALVDLGQLSAGQTVLVHAGSGGVGVFAIQLAAHLGARVATTASARNFPLLRSLGAEILVDYRTERFEDRVGAVDLVLDTQGGETLRRSFGVLRRGGRLVTIGGLPTPESLRDDPPGPAIRTVLGAAHLGHRWRAWRSGVEFAYLFMRPDGAQLAELARLADAGRLRPVIDTVYPLAQAKEALAQVEAGHAVGKVVISMTDAPE